MEENENIVFNEISKTYAADLKRKSIALTDLSFSVQQGEVFGIIGPNGAGKSTALKILMGFVQPSSGSVTISGSTPNDQTSHQKIGYLPEHPCLYEHLTILDHFQFAGRLARTSKKKLLQRSKQLLEFVNLSHAVKQPIRRFSKGMTQRAALAYALFHEPEILILDEPMSGLDPLGRQLVVDIIRDYNKKGHTILFCSHILTDVERICNRIGIMHQGRLAAITSPEELKKNPPSDDTGIKTPLESLFLQTVTNTTHE